MKNNLQKNSLLERIEGCFFDLIFPSACVGCQTEGELMCEKCRNEIECQSLQVCPVCEQTVTISGELCGLCKSKSDAPLQRLVVSASYQDKTLARAIHFYKYKFAYELAAPLGKILEKSLSSHKVSVPDVIVPVPLHQRRLRWRGFNQAELLANYLSDNITPLLSIPVQNNALVRTRNTRSQMKVKDYSARFENIAGAFSIKPGFNSSLITGNNVLLVDDVCTTGATIFECACQLQTLNPRSITAIVLARQG